jgi:hypothetical protein
MYTDADARWLFDALTSSSLKRDVKLSRGRHLMYLGRRATTRSTVRISLSLSAPTRCLSRQFLSHQTLSFRQPAGKQRFTHVLRHL